MKGVVGKSGRAAIFSLDEVAVYPEALLVRRERVSRDVEIRVFESADVWQEILAYYRQQLTPLGWSEFAAHSSEDRGTISFRHPKSGTLTILAADEDESTRIQLYLKK